MSIYDKKDANTPLNNEQLETMVFSIFISLSAFFVAVIATAPLHIAAGIAVGILWYPIIKAYAIPEAKNWVKKHFARSK